MLLTTSCLTLALTILVHSIVHLVSIHGSVVAGERWYVRSTGGVTRYPVVAYIAQKTEDCDAKVKLVNIPPNEFHMHVHFAWEKAMHPMSTVIIDHNGQILGANLVLPVNSLADLYAPGNISHVVDFATNCYAWARSKDPSGEPVESYVSTLRAYNRDDVNRYLIQHTVAQFLIHSKPGSQHFVWEAGSVMHDFMVAQNYTKIACGNSADEPNPCDWQRAGLPGSAASKLCLYRTTSPMWKLQPI